MAAEAQREKGVAVTYEERVTNEARARILKALAHPSRVFMVDKLQSGPRSVLELTQMVGTDVSTVSRHLAVLKSAGIVRDERDGNTVYYSLACPCVQSFFEGVEVVFRHNLDMQTAVIANELNKSTAENKAK